MALPALRGTPPAPHSTGFSDSRLKTPDSRLNCWRLLSSTQPNSTARDSSPQLNPTPLVSPTPPLVGASTRPFYRHGASPPPFPARRGGGGNSRSARLGSVVVAQPSLLFTSSEGKFQEVLFFSSVNRVFFYRCFRFLYLLRIHRVGWRRCYSLGRPLSVGMLAVMEKVVVVVEMRLWLLK